MKCIKTEDAVGHVLCHDMTQIIPGKEKGAAFVAGQELSAGDICRLQQMGKNRVYVQENTPHPEGWVHEDDAARGFARLMPGDGVEVEAAPREGKVNFRATRDGMLLVDTERLERFNLVPDVMCCTRHNYSVLIAGTRLAGSRAIPLFLSRPGFLKALSVLEDGPLFKVVPMRKAKIGILVTGTEVFQGLIEDRFAPIITQKAQQHHCEVVKTLFAPDDADLIVRGVRDLLDAGADFIVTTAGMSVDPDDLTRKGLTEAGLTDTLYGVPALPGTMTLIGRIGGAQIIEPRRTVRTAAFQRHGPYVLIPVPESQAAEPLRAACSHCPGLRKRIIRSLHRFHAFARVQDQPGARFPGSKFLTQRIYAVSNPGDIIVLRNQEGDDHLPQILTEDPHAPAKGHGRLQVLILRVHRTLHRFIVGIHIKIGTPDPFKFSFLTGKQKAAFVLHDFHILFSRCSGPYSAAFRFRGGPHAEALTGFRQLAQIHIFYLCLVHSRSPFC